MLNVPTSFARSKKPMDNLPAPQCSSVFLDPLFFTEFAGWESASLEPESPKRQRKRHPAGSLYIDGAVPLFDGTYNLRVTSRTFCSQLPVDGRQIGNVAHEVHSIFGCSGASRGRRLWCKRGSVAKL